VELAGMWRYPVKSMRGEALAAAEIGASGMAGDRRWGVRVEASGTVLSAKCEGRFPTFASQADETDDAWAGRRCSVGEVELEIIKPCSRCMMVTRVQRGRLDRQFGVLSHLSSSAGRSLGVLWRVVQPGAVSLHAPVTLK
jgi:uncharacterized protein YcbX